VRSTCLIGFVEFRLNSLVLLHRLFLNGLSFTGHSAARLSRTGSTGSALTSPATTLSKGGLALLAKFRSTLHRSLLQDTTQAAHICAIDGLFKAGLREGDLHHAILSTLILASLQDHAKQRNWNAERQALLLLLLLGYLQRLGALLHIESMTRFAEGHLEGLRSRGVNIFDLEAALEDYPPPLCLRSSADPDLSKAAVSFAELRALFLTLPDMTAEQGKVINSAFDTAAPYTPEVELEAMGRGAAAGDNVGRRSLFPASPKKPLGHSGTSAALSESASSTVLAHQRHSMVNIFCPDGALTVPSFGPPPLTRHQVGSSTSITSATSSQLSRASSLQHKSKAGGKGLERPVIFRSLNASADSLSIGSGADSDADSQLSVLDGDFAHLKLRNQERAREIRERSYSMLQ